MKSGAVSGINKVISWEKNIIKSNDFKFKNDRVSSTDVVLFICKLYEILLKTKKDNTKT